MEKLTIKGFMNEMSYKLNMEELEALVIDYQDVIIDYIINNQYVFKNKKEVFEVCELIRSDKYFRTLSMLIESGDERIQSDMAYILYTATNYNCVDEQMKGEALRLGYMLREMEFGNDIVNDQATNTCILISMVKSPQWFETTPHIRSKSVENILRTMPELLYNAYHENYDAKQIPTKVILTILSKAIVGLRGEEIITAFCKYEFPNDIDKELRPFALRIRAFIYELCGLMKEENVMEALKIASISLMKFNSRTNSNDSFTGKYLDFNVLDSIVNQVKDKTPANMLQTYKVIKRFIKENEKFEHLF